MNIYLAGGIDSRELLRLVRDHLHAKGHRVTSRWIDVEFKLTVGQPDYHKYARLWAHQDLTDIAYADLMVADVETGGRGTFLEIGYAMAKGIRVALVGERPNSVFMHADMDGVDCYKDWTQFIGEI